MRFLVAFLSLSILALGAGQETLRSKALKFGNSVPDYIIYQPDMTPLKDAFSVCSWVRSLRSTASPCWLSYAAGSYTNEILVSDNGYYNHIFHSHFDLRSNFYVSSGTWYHYCYSWSSSSETQKVYLNGKLIGGRYTPSGRTLTPNGYLVIGNEQNGSPGTGMKDAYIFGGELYKLNFFSKELSSSEVQEMAKSKCSEVEMTYGDVRSIKWEDILQRERNGDVTDIDTECEASEPVKEEYGELKPSSAQHAVTRDNNEDLYGAWRAIDGDMNTKSYTEKGTSDNKWLKLNYDGVKCVQQVMWYYNNAASPTTTWTCSADGCSCSGSYCSWSTVEVGVAKDVVDGVEDVTGAGGDTSKCKRGDTVLFKFTGSWYVSFSEIKTTGLLGAVAVDGGWSEFGDWSECSKECGGGTQTRSRTCSNPAPSDGGADCEGDATQEQSCNTDACEETGDFVMAKPLSIEQSATRDGNEKLYGAWRAIDGDMTTKSYTEQGSNKWLRVNLDGMSCVQTVKWFYNNAVTPTTTWTCGGDGCTCTGSYCSWSTVEVGVGEDGAGEVSAAGGDASDAKCRRGKAVLFKFTGSWYVSFDEIQITAMQVSDPEPEPTPTPTPEPEPWVPVYGKLKPSSAEHAVTRDNNEETYGAWRAIDGNMNTKSYTEKGTYDKWLKVNLAKTQCVQKVMWYYNNAVTPTTTYTCSADGCSCSGSYCSWSSVQVGGGKGEGVGEVSAVGGDSSECRHGDTVLFKFTGSWYTSFSEIEITGVINEKPLNNLRNIAADGKATQSNNGWDGVAPLAIDGNRSGKFDDNSCSHTGDLKDGWWNLEFPKQVNVQNVVIYNRLDECCSDRIGGVTVYADESLCGTIEYVEGQAKYKVGCGGDTLATNIRIKAAENQYLTLCEVEVWGVKEEEEETTTDGGEEEETQTGCDVDRCGDYGECTPVGASGYTCDCVDGNEFDEHAGTCLPVHSQYKTVYGEKSTGDNAHSVASCPDGTRVVRCHTFGAPSAVDGVFITTSETISSCEAKATHSTKFPIMAVAYCGENNLKTDPCDSKNKINHFEYRKSPGQSLSPSVSCPPGYIMESCIFYSPWSQLLTDTAKARINSIGAVGIGEDGSCAMADCLAEKPDNSFCSLTAVCKKLVGEEYQKAACPTCDNMRCAEGQECQIVEELPQCVERIPGGCEENKCGEGECIEDGSEYTCKCYTGYEFMDKTCVDVDECLEDPCGNGKCTNSPGSYSCVCDEGYELVKGTCEDVDECLDNPCSDTERCSNIEGAFICDCLDTFIKDPESGDCVCADGFENKDGKCADVDECATNPCTGENEECVNTVGNYNCKCSEGFERVEDDTCQEIAGVCDIKAKKSKIKAYKGTNVNVKLTGESKKTMKKYAEITWTKDNDPFNPKDQGKEKINGFMLRKFDANDAGVYVGSIFIVNKDGSRLKCQVNCEIEMLEGSVTLTIDNKAKLMGPQKAGKQLAIKCDADILNVKLEDPKSPDNVNWYKVTEDGDVLLDDSDSISIARAKGTYQLIFNSPTPEDSGTYRCEFDQQGVDASTEVTIEVV